MIFVDANIWCYYFDRRLPEHEHVRELMRKIIKSEEIVCNTIVVMEVAHYLVRHFKGADARRKIGYFVNLRNMNIVDFDRSVMTEALESPRETSRICLHRGFRRKRRRGNSDVGVIKTEENNLT
ncbi:type II toxin-antitoxin system VapC family toxin [Candidatus Bathyarchaeota archaeon]|nr:MAG: type II toxin-antitoxin system VapC family toxin [Candidatus Bathyarchaeota archaeon]